MARRSGRARLVLSAEEEVELKRLSTSRTGLKREVERAKILLLYAAGDTVTQIMRKTCHAKRTIYKCIDKALSAGAQMGLRDAYHRPQEPAIGDDAKAWLVNLACTKPKDHGLAAEMWTYSALATHARVHAVAAGHECLSRIAKGTVWRILDQHEIKPHRIEYYLERRDPEFDDKMREVLTIYREVAMQMAQPEPTQPPTVFTVSVDEKPGVQALGLTAPDLPPAPYRHAGVGRDHEYVRHGVVSILAALDLHDGRIIAQVHDRHRSCEFIQLLQALDAYYPAGATIRVILDNHSAHISKETMAYLATRPGRFVYVHTPKHGSWLNLVETAFSKMARSFLRHIRVASKEELKDRILKGIAEFNAAPVVFRWKNFDRLRTD